MELKPEWRGRIESWLKTLENDVFSPETAVDASAFFTYDHLTLEEALAQSFSPLEPGSRWGETWQYMWVKARAVIPESLDGKRVVMDADVGGEACIWVNGAEFGCRRNEWVKSKLHRICDLELTSCARAGDVYDIVCEVYAGHPYPFDNMPVTGGRRPADPASSEKGPRAVYGGIRLGEWDETAYQLYMDAGFLFDSLNVISEDTLRHDEIWEALKEFTAAVDFGTDKPSRTASYAAAREMLRPVMECKNGTCSPLMYAFGHAHIDVAWLWPLSETERKVMRTFAAQLRHMDRYPEYKFIQSQAQLYVYVKQYYPAMYERIREKVAAGQWIPEGGMWVEADTNVSSGEALIRQFVHGKRFFRDEFGYDCRMLWLPDVFGYNAALPEIMKGCGIDCFCTQKLTWAYNGGEPFPLNYFDWVGLDGTRIPTFIHGNYTSNTNPSSTAELWKTRKQHNGLKGFIMPYGYGDGGGGPPRSYIEDAQRCRDFQGLPRLENKHPLDFFRDNPQPPDEYVGELYLQCHRGTLTSQAKTKKNNRKCELSLRETEFWGQIARFSGYEYPLKEADGLWKKVLLNQFHDILPGSSINRVYREAEAAAEQVLDASRNIRGGAMDVLLSGEGLTVTNSLSFPRRAAVTLPEGTEGVCDGNGPVPVQAVGSRTVALVDLPACGLLALKKCAPMPASPEVRAEITSFGAIMENSVMRVEFDCRGAITCIFDKVSGRRLSKGLCNDFRMYRDDPIHYDAWDIDSTYEACPVELAEPASFEVEATDGFMAGLRITRSIGSSKLVQTALLLSGEKRMDFVTEIDWRETHKLLKVCFDTDMMCDSAINEIQFGYVKRPTHRSRQYDYDRFEVANYRYTALAESGRGFAVINDCKYGVNQLGSRISLTLLRSAVSPDPKCDLGVQSFTYGFVAYDGSFAEGDVIRAAADLNVPPEVYPGTGRSGSFMSVDVSNVMIDTLKPAEDGSGDYILRLYEAAGNGVNTVLTLSTPCARAQQCDMLEEEASDIPFEKCGNGVRIPLSFGAFEIKTLRISPDAAGAV